MLRGANRSAINITNRSTEFSGMMGRRGRSNGADAADYRFADDGALAILVS
jgi:hypothetical protein